MTATRFDESKHRRHAKGGRHGGRFAPKPAPQPADVAAPLPVWHLAMWRRCGFYDAYSRDIRDGPGQYGLEIRVQVIDRWKAPAATACDAVRRQMTEAARRLGAPQPVLDELDSGWAAENNANVVDLPGTGGACTALPLPTSSGVFFLEAGRTPPRNEWPLSKNYRPAVVTPPKMVEAVRKQVLASGHDDLAARAVCLAVQMLKECPGGDVPPQKACPENPALLVETLARLGRRSLLRSTLSSDTDPPKSLLTSGLYARLLGDLPGDPFAWGSGDPPQLVSNFANYRKNKFVYRPANEHFDNPASLETSRSPMSVGAVLLRAAANTDRLRFDREETDLHKTDALVAAARRSETGALIGFAAGFFPPHETPAKAAVKQMLNDPANRWCDPDAFRRKIVTLYTTAYACDTITKASESRRRQSRYNKPLSVYTRKEVSKKLGDALAYVVAEPGEPVTTAETECVNTLLTERGALIPAEDILDPETPPGPAVYKFSSTLSRQQQMACQHHVNPELAIPQASARLEARIRDYAQWITAHDNQTRRPAICLTAALLTVPDLPPGPVAFLFAQQQKALLAEAGAQ